MDSIIEVLKMIHFENETWKLVLPLILMGIDILTGLIKSWVTKTFESSKMRSGLGKKIGEITILVLGIVFSVALGLPKYLMTGISIYIVFMEAMSVFENLERLNVPIPKFVSTALSSINHTINEEDDIEKIASSANALKQDIGGKDDDAPKSEQH